MDTSATVKDKTTDASREINLERDALQRLDLLLAENAEFEKTKGFEADSDTRSESSDLTDTIPTESAVAQLGLLTGAIPTSAIFLKLIFDGPGSLDPAGAVALTLIILASLAATSAAGYFSGRVAGRMLFDLEQRPWAIMLLGLPLLGAIWGLVSGAVGGFILLGIGAIFGGAIGAVVGAAVLTIFGIIHRTIKNDDQIDQRQFLPLAFGITSVIAAFILGL